MQEPKICGYAFIGGNGYPIYDIECKENEHTPEHIHTVCGKGIFEGVVRDFYRCTKCGKIVGEIKKE